MSRYIFIVKGSSKEPRLQWDDVGRCEIADAMKTLCSNIHDVGVSPIYPALFIRGFDLNKIPPYKAILSSIKIHSLFGYYFVETDQPVLSLDFLLMTINEIERINENMVIFHISKCEDPIVAFDNCFAAYDSAKESIIIDAIDVFKTGLKAADQVEKCLKNYHNMGLNS